MIWLQNKNSWFHFISVFNSDSYISLLVNEEKLEGLEHLIDTEMTNLNSSFWIFCLTSRIKISLERRYFGRANELQLLQFDQSKLFLLGYFVWHLKFWLQWKEKHSIIVRNNQSFKDDACTDESLILCACMQAPLIEWAVEERETDDPTTQHKIEN